MYLILQRLAQCNVFRPTYSCSNHLCNLTGITAGAGICAELGIPMTHRGVATSVRFLTGHARASGEADLDEAVAAAADPHTTLIVYMGLKMLPTLTAQLLGAPNIL